MAMKKFINDPKNLTRELLEGFAIAHGDVITVKSEKIVCRAKPKPANKVALVTLGGAGHEPALSGFVGEGMLDFSVVGDIFAAPGPPKVLEALRLAKRDGGHPVRRAEPRRRRDERQHGDGDGRQGRHHVQDAADP